MKLTTSNVAIIKRLLVGRNNRPLRSILSRLEPADLASLLGQFNRREFRLLTEALLSLGQASEAFAELPEAQLADFLRLLEGPQVVQLLQQATVDEAAYLAAHVEEEELEGLLNEVDADKALKVRQFLAYPEDSAGRIMQSHIFSIPSHLSAQEGLDQIRARAQKESIYYIYVVDEKDCLLGVVSLREMATAPQEQPVAELAKKELIFVRPEDSAEEAGRLVSRYDLIAVPVLDQENRVLGIVTVDDVLDIIQEQATADIYASAGLQEDDRVYTPARTKIKNRIPWMLLNLFLAALASSVVSLFEETMSQLIILASVKNIVAGMGGNTAIQTLTVVTRGLATDDFNFISYSKAVVKETIVGLSIGLCTGIGAGLLVYVWKGDMMVALVICISMILNSLVASTFGAAVPIFLKKMNLDPATGSGVIVTMITDIFSFFSFLGIATLGLKYFL